VKGFLLQCAIKAAHYSLVCIAGRVGDSAGCSATGDDNPPTLFKYSRIFSQSHRIAEIRRDL